MVRRRHDVPHPLPRPARHRGAAPATSPSATRCAPTRRSAPATPTLKTGIVEGGLIEGHQYTYRKQAWIADVHRRLGVERPPIAPPATIGILGGGQLGRMLGLAARAMGYRIAVLDPDPDCPAAARRRPRRSSPATTTSAGRSGWPSCSDVVTYELEHVAAEVVDAIDAIRPVRPGRVPLHVTQDRLAERRFVESAGADVAPWREVRDDRRPARPPRPSSGCRSGSRSRPAATTAAASSGSRDRPSSTARSSASVAPAGDAAPRRARARLRGGAVDRRRARRRSAGSPTFPLARNRPRRGHPRRERRAGRRSTADVADRAADARRAAGGGDGPDRHADRRAVPDARRPARRQRARAARPQQRPLDDRGRRDVAVRAAHPGDLRPATSASTERARADGDGQPARARAAARRPARPRSAWRARWPTRPSTSTCTTSGGCSSAARWAT